MSGHGSSGGGGNPDRRSWGKDDFRPRPDGGYTHEHESETTYSGGNHGGGHSSGHGRALGWVGAGAIALGLVAAGFGISQMSRPHTPVEAAERGGTTAPAEDTDAAPPNPEETPELIPTPSGLSLRVVVPGVSPGEQVRVLFIDDGEGVSQEGYQPLDQFEQEVRVRLREEKIAEVMAMADTPITREVAERNEAVVNIPTTPLSGVELMLTVNADGTISIPANIGLRRGEQTSTLSIDDNAAFRIITSERSYNLMLGPDTPAGATVCFDVDGRFTLRR